jgi:hypothetical protein
MKKMNSTDPIKYASLGIAALSTFPAVYGCSISTSDQTTLPSTSSVVASPKVSSSTSTVVANPKTSQSTSSLAASPKASPSTINAFDRAKKLGITLPGIPEVPKGMVFGKSQKNLATSARSFVRENNTGDLIPESASLSDWVNAAQGADKYLEYCSSQAACDIGASYQAIAIAQLEAEAAGK